MNQKMRKIYSFAVAAVAMFAAVSCAKEIVQDNQQAGMPENDALAFVASVDGADDASESKSVIDGLKSYWNGEEKIWILDPREETNDEGTFFNTSWKKIFTANAEMSETATFVEDDKNTSLEGESLMALYPAGPAGGAYWEGGESLIQGMWLSNEQTAVAGSYDPTAHIAIARASKSSNLLEFKNVSSLLKFQVAENIKGEVKFISYEPTAGEAPRISGNFSVDYNDGEPVVTPESGENKITFDAVALKGEFAVDNDYYMAILPAKLEAGFAVQINGYTVKELKDSRSLTDEKFASLLDRKRNMILNLGTVSLNFGICGTHTDWESDTPMSYDEASGLYVAQDVTFAEETNEFKIRSNGLWATSVGTGGAIAVDSRNQAYMDGGNSMIAAGTYDIWFDADRKIIYAMSDGNTPADLKFASMVYLKPAAGWSSDDATFAAYFFGDPVGPIAIMIQDSDSDGIYEAAVPKGDYSQLLFVRLSSDTESFDWNRTLHQTFDLETPMSDNDKLCYVITTMPDSHKYSEGIWQTLEEAKYVAPEFVAQEGYIYLQPSSKWLENNARFAAYFFNGTWADMTLVEGQKDIYQCAIPEGEINVIFCRMNPSATENSWTNKWNQTGDLKMTDGSLYIVSGDEGSWTGDPAVTEPEPEPDQPEVVVGYWAVTGTMNDWGDYAKLTLDGDWHVATEVKLTKADQFKLRADGDWGVNRGAAEGEDGVVVIENNVETAVVQGGKDFSVAENGMYSVYINKAATKVKVVRTGDIPLPSVKNWGIVGTITKWGTDPDIPMTLNGDWYIASGVEMPAGTAFKFRVDGKWASDGGEELTYSGSVVSGTEYNVSAGSSDISVTSGAIYDVYLSHDETKMKVVKVGDLPDPDIMAKDGYVYLLPNSNWTQGNARFSIYLCNGSKAATWISMTKVEGTAYYEVQLPSDFSVANYKHIIFVRLNPSTSANNWNDGVKWNQTSDLECREIDTNGKNCYAIKAGTWDKGGGTWSKVTKLN